MILCYPTVQPQVTSTVPTLGCQMSNTVCNAAFAPPSRRLGRACSLGSSRGTETVSRLGRDGCRTDVKTALSRWDVLRKLHFQRSPAEVDWQAGITLRSNDSDLITRRSWCCEGMPEGATIRHKGARHLSSTRPWGNFQFIRNPQPLSFPSSTPRN